MLNAIPSLSDIKDARERIFKYVLQTPVYTSHKIDEIAGCELLFKCENFQKTGAFKMRGASNAIFSQQDRKVGFACHSSGNHGQAVALASKLAGAKAYVVMPNNSIKAKLEAVKAYGAEVILCEPDEEAREQACRDTVVVKGVILIHPFNDYNIIAGQATASLEFFEEVGTMDYLLTPVGGGGLSAGTALTTHYMHPETKFILAEPDGANDTYRSFKKGSIEHVGVTNTIADGLRTTVGEKNFEIIKAHAEDVLTATDDEIIAAMKLIWERMKIIIEPSSAVPFATVLKNKDRFSGKKVGIIISGGNVDLSNLPFNL